MSCPNVNVSLHKYIRTVHTSYVECLRHKIGSFAKIVEIEELHTQDVWLKRLERQPEHLGTYDFKFYTRFNRTWFEWIRQFFYYPKFRIADTAVNGILIYLIDFYPIRFYRPPSSDRSTRSNRILRSAKAHVMLDFFIGRKGVNINSVDTFNNRSVLIKLCEFNLGLTLITKAIQAGAIVSAKDIYEYTALHYAVVYCEIDVVKKLLDHGANVMAHNVFGYTPLHLARYGSNSSQELYTLLLSYVPEGTVVRQPFLIELLRPVHFYINCCYYTCILDSANFGNVLEQNTFDCCANISCPLLVYNVYGSKLDASNLSDSLMMPLKSYEKPREIEISYSAYARFISSILSKRKRLELLQTLCEKGAIVTRSDISVAFKFFGFDEEVKLLINYSTDHIRNTYCDFNYTNFTWIDVLCGYDSVVNYVNAIRSNRCNPSTSTITNTTKKEIQAIVEFSVVPSIIREDFIRYCILMNQEFNSRWYRHRELDSTAIDFDELEQQLTIEDQNFVKKIREQPKVISLRELSRDALRKYAIIKCSPSHPKIFHSYINSLPLPKGVIDYVLLSTKGINY